MDKVRFTSLKMKVWEDKFFRLEKKGMLHLDDIRLPIEFADGDNAILTNSPDKRKEIEENPAMFKGFQLKSLAGKDATEFYGMSSQH